MLPVSPSSAIPSRPVVGRLAPTPSGALHLGNVVAFAAAWLSVRRASGKVLLRIEDVDTGRARTAIAESQRADLEWLGLDWDEEVRPQSERDYAPALEALGARTYRCDCTRKQIREAGGRYRGRCRDRALAHGAVRLRLSEQDERFHDLVWGAVPVMAETLSDPVLRRADGVYAYNLAVVADDIADGVTEVVRGADLRDQTGVQLQLWRALSGQQPSWMHTPVLLGPDGKKLSKSHQSSSVADLRELGWQPEAIWPVILRCLGLDGASLAEAVDDFAPARIPKHAWRLERTPGPPGDLALVREPE